MRFVLIPLLAVVATSGCMTLHAKDPEDAVRQMAREDGVDVAALCSHDGRGFSEGAIVSMEGRRMTCNETGRWVPAALEGEETVSLLDRGPTALDPGEQCESCRE